MGRLGRPKGLKGWLHLQSWTDPPEAILDYPAWHLRSSSGQRQMVAVAEADGSPKGLLVRLEGVAQRETAEPWVGCIIEVPRAELPPLEPGEHYRHDLIGYRVRNLEGVEFGTVEGFEDLPANAVMVVKGERERWVPTSREHLREIDDAAKTILVDWPADL